MKRSIYVIGYGYGIENLLPRFGYHVYTDGTIGDNIPDIVGFMGGVDIDTKLYGEEKIPQTQTPNRQRDAKEIALYHKYKGIPKLGICRGAQLLNVLNGGSLWQHVDNHGYAHHEIEDVYGNRILSSSVHHQMMIPCKNSKIIAWTAPRTTVKISAGKVSNEKEPEPEILWIESKRELLIQGHPEFGPDEFTEYSMDLIDKLIWRENVSVRSN